MAGASAKGRERKAQEGTCTAKVIVRVDGRSANVQRWASPCVQDAQYVAAQHEAGEPLTAAGVAIACGTVRVTINRYGTGDYDHWCLDTEDKYRDQLDGEALFVYDYLIGGEHDGKKIIYLSNVVHNYWEIASAEREQRLYKRGSVADIFALKAVDGWQDDTNKGVTNQTLVIAGGDSAEAALKLLGYTKSE